MPVPNDVINIPDLELCREAIKRAVTIKLNFSPNVKKKDSEYLVLAGIDHKVACHQTMIMWFRRELERTLPFDSSMFERSPVRHEVYLAAVGAID